MGEDPVVSRLGEAGGPNSGRGRTSSMNPYANEMQPSRNGVAKDDSEEIEILHTDTLIKKVFHIDLFGILLVFASLQNCCYGRWRRCLKQVILMH